MLFERYERQMYVETTLCLSLGKQFLSGTTCDFVLTSIQCNLNVMDVRCTLKERCVFLVQGRSIFTS